VAEQEPATIEIADPRRLETDDETWDAFVAAAPQATHLQTTPWAATKRANAWHARRVAVAADGSALGAQMLVRRAGRLPWALGYIARGPVGADLDAAGLEALTARLREEAGRDRLAYVLFEPEAEVGSGVEKHLAGLGWQRAASVQPESTRIVDLTRSPDELWSDLRGKWRQYVTKSRKQGIRVVAGDEQRLAEFYRIHAGAQRHAGVVPRAESSFRLLWDKLAPRGMVRLLIAESEKSGEGVAGLLIVSCGRRTTELYGGSTPEGNTARANYLLKWESIVRSRELGFAEYDMWGLPNPGIAHFKAGFGGREVTYVGAWRLTVDRVGAAALSTGIALRERYLRLRYGRAAAHGGGHQVDVG
jgi:lipid II:glycine glycyltransferase (peptidoglycan interpeptide bridge formation enzyme)